MIADSCPPLTFFPDIQADETIYSACTRYHFRSGYSDSATTSTRLLGHARGGKHQDLPVGVARLSRLTGGAIAANETTLRERTVLRAYLPLMSLARREKVVGACLRSTKSVLAKAYSGLSYGITTDHRLRHLRISANVTDDFGERDRFERSVLSCVEWIVGSGRLKVDERLRG